MVIAYVIEVTTFQHILLPFPQERYNLREEKKTNEHDHNKEERPYDHGWQ
jgi:hypothetical protein